MASGAHSWVGSEVMTTGYALQSLRERLLTGWAPKATEIDCDVPQIDALNWGWSDAGRITYQTTDRSRRSPARSSTSIGT